MDRLQQIEQLPEWAAQKSPKTLVIAGGERVEDLEVYRALLAMPFIERCLLVGNSEAIARSAAELEVEVRPQDVLAVEDHETVARRVVQLIEDREADIILKGYISSPILNRQILKLKTRNTISLVTLFQADCIAGGRPMLFTDAGVTVDCSFGRLVDMTRNAIEVARSVLNVSHPRVALVSGNEKIIPSLESTVTAAKLTEIDWGDAIVYGPLSFDLATDEEAGRQKGISQQVGQPINEVAGKADILVFPSLDAANVVYKILMSMVQAGQASMAGVTAGVKAPYILLSRADNLDTKLSSIALACVYAEWQRFHSNSAPSKILTVNPGATGTKLALFENDRCVQNRELEYNHKPGLRGAAFDQEVDRYVEKIQEFLAQCGDVQPDAVVGRGGFLNRENTRVESGVYEVAACVDGKVTVRPDIVEGVRDYAEMDHISNLGIPIAARTAEQLGCPAFSVDPVVADDFEPVARYSGYKPIERRSVAHVLSVRASARKAARQLKRPFEQCRFVVVHMSDGITVAAICDGKMVDNSPALLGEGPFTPLRAGSLPQKGLIDLCFSGQFTKTELFEELTKNAGLKSYLGEDDIAQIERRIAEDDAETIQAIDAMVYQIAKEVGAMYIAAGSDVHAIVVSGELAGSNEIVDRLKLRTFGLAEAIVFPNNVEMEAMARGALRALRGEQKVKQYQLHPPADDSSADNDNADDPPAR